MASRSKNMVNNVCCCVCVVILVLVVVMLVRQGSMRNEGFKDHGKNTYEPKTNENSARKFETEVLKNLNPGPFKKQFKQFKQFGKNLKKLEKK